MAPCTPEWLPKRTDAPGLLLALGTGLAALAIRRMLPPSPYVSDVLLAIVLGALVVNTPLRGLLRLSVPSAEQTPNAYAAGLCFTGKWILRLAIIGMGLKVQTQFFGAQEIALIACVAIVSIPSAFFVAQAAGARFGLALPLVDLVAGGTMICGASAVQAIAPVAHSRRDEQGVAIATVFVFSVAALLCFHPIALFLDLPPNYAGLWSGLAVNDLSSAIAVGQQMGGAGDAGGVMAAASKSARVLLLAPTLLVFAFLRKNSGPIGSKSATPCWTSHLPGFLLGYALLAAVRAAGDRWLAGSAAWSAVLDVNHGMVDIAMVAVSASIGLHLELNGLLRAGVRALAVGGVTSAWMAGITLAMVHAAARGRHMSFAVIAVAALAGSYAVCTLQFRRARRRF